MTDSLVQTRRGPLTWQVPARLQQQLLGKEGLRLEEWLEAGQAQVVKHGPHRTVYRVTLLEAVFYVKHYRLPDLRSWLRQCFRPAKARMEFQSALAVASRNIKTILPLAIGENTSRPSDSFLLTYCLEDAEPLCDFLISKLSSFPEPRQSRLRHRLAHELGRLVGHLHNVGINHQDLHAANLLLQLEPGDIPHLFLIDLHDIRLGPPLPWAACRRNLTLLNRWFILRVSRADRFRFWKSYWAEKRGLPGAGRELARQVEDATTKSNLLLWHHRDRRCLGQNRYFGRVAAIGMRGHFARDLAPSDLNELLRDPDGAFNRPGVRILKQSPSSTVAELQAEVEGKEQAVIFKRFSITKRADPLANLLRASPAIRSWQAGHGLQLRCLPTPRPLAVFHRFRGGFGWEGYLLVEKVSQAVDLREAVIGRDDRASAGLSFQLFELIENVAQLIRTMHERCVSHRDLKANNLLVNERGIWLVDLVGVRLDRHLAQAERVRNLARLHASFLGLSRTDKLRFLRSYLQWGLKGKSGWKSWWLAIAAATSAKILKNQRRGRPLA